MSQKSQSDQYTTELTHQLNQRDHELSELKQVYRDKKRQCDAWEKVYKSLKTKVDQQDQQVANKENQPNYNQPIQKLYKSQIPIVNTTTSQSQSTKHSKYISGRNDTQMNVNTTNHSYNEYRTTEPHPSKPISMEFGNSPVSNVNNVKQSHSHSNSNSYMNNKHSAPQLHQSKRNCNI